MDVKNFVLSYYKDSTDGFHIHRVEGITEASKPHTHDYFQIYYVIKGKLTHHIKDTSSELSRGDMFIVPPGDTHYIEKTPDTVFYSFSFMEDSLGNTGDKLGFLKTLKTDKNIRPKITVESEEILYIETIMEHILKEFTQKPLGYSETLRSYAILLITLFSRHYIENLENISGHFESNKQIVLHCIAYIEENFTEDISLEEISKRCNLSKSCFCKLFCDITGYSFKNYLNLIRIKKSIEYIKKGYKVTGIYGLCGFNDFSTFYRNFKKVMGTSPQEFKKNTSVDKPVV